MFIFLILENNIIMFFLKTPQEENEFGDNKLFLTNKRVNEVQRNDWDL